MKRMGDLLMVALLGIIVWGGTLTILMLPAITVIEPNEARSISIVVATVAAIVFVALWIKGRSASKGESGAEAHRVVSDCEVVRSYCELLVDLDTSNKIYDQTLLPYPKERILSAAIHVLEREDSPEIMRSGAVLATELSQFQNDIGSTPQSTLMSVMLESIPSDGTDGIEQHARKIANHKKTDTEIKSDRERERLLSLINNSLRKVS